MKWLRDEDFIRAKVPMTKFEIRVLTIAMLGLGPGQVFADVGAGTGSIALQAALLGAEAHAIEMEEKALELMAQNEAHLGVKLITYAGPASQEIAKLPALDAAFVGGSKGELVEIVAGLHDKLKPGGRLVANFIRLENLSSFRQEVERLGYLNLEVRLLQGSFENKLRLLTANNPVFLLGATKP